MTEVTDLSIRYIDNAEISFISLLNAKKKSLPGGSCKTRLQRSFCTTAISVGRLVNSLVCSTIDVTTLDVFATSCCSTDTLDSVLITTHTNLKLLKFLYFVNVTRELVFL